MIAKTPDRRATATDQQNGTKLLFLLADIMHLLHTLFIIIEIFEMEIKLKTTASIAHPYNSRYDWGMDDNTFECPNCGAKVYPEMTRCSQCGQNMYPEDEESSPADTTTNATGWSSIVGAVLLGWIIATSIALLLHFIIASLINPPLLGSMGKVILFLAGPLGSLVGGYVAAGVARQHSKLLGGVMGILTLPVLVLFSTHWVEVTISFLLSPWVLLAGLITILTGVCGGWLNEMFGQDSHWKEKWKVHGWEDLLYQDLLRKVRFNGSIADRLIEFERKQDPQANRLKLIQSAIDRLDRDNR